MKKSELKNIIKECVKEVIFEEGVLSGIITEVAQGLAGTSTIAESQTGPVKVTPPTKARRAVLDSIGKGNYKAPANDKIEKARASFSNSALFEGTTPIQEEGAPSQGPGIDISNLPGMGNWGDIASGLK